MIKAEKTEFHYSLDISRWKLKLNLRENITPFKYDEFTFWELRLFESFPPENVSSALTYEISLSIFGR